MPSIQIENVSKLFGSVTAVNDVSLEIPDGTLLAILGPSGCGKTTLLRMIAGLESPTSGEIKIGERVIVSVRRGILVPPERRDIGMVFQSYAIWPHMTVRENVLFPLKVRRVPKSEAQQMLKNALSLVNLEGLEDRLPSQLSGGQQQRVALARALVYRPTVLLLDEPLSNLDANLRIRMKMELKELHQRLGLTMLYVTHDRTEAFSLAGKVVIMSSGMISQEGHPAEVWNNPRNSFVANFIGWQVLFSGVVTPDNQVFTDEGTLLCKGAEGFEQGSRVDVAIKTSGIRVLPTGSPPASQNCIPATVRYASLVEDYYEITVLVGDRDVLIKTPASSRPPRSGACYLHVSPEDCSAIMPA